MLKNSPEIRCTVPSIPPRVVRYLETNNIKKFFETGELLLTSYSRCKNHEDKSRKDSNEGKSQYEVTYNGAYGNQKTCGWHDVGAGSYMLCTSKVESEALMRKFSVNGYFWINDVLEFSEAISKCIPDFLTTKYGCCTYQDTRVLSKQKTNPFMPLIPSKPFEDEDHEKISQILYDFQNKLSEHYYDAAEETFFLKEKHYSDEEEFRIIWNTSNKVDGYLIIKCPQAIQFCTNVT